VRGYSVNASLRSTSAYRSHTAAGCAHRVRWKCARLAAISTLTAVLNDAPDSNTCSAHTNGPSFDVPANSAATNKASPLKVAELNQANLVKVAERSQASPLKVAESNRAFPIVG
jgi:hypothetical protein